MRRPHLDLPGAFLPAGLAALTTWVSLWAWAGFVESPGRYLVPTLGAVLLVAVSGALLRAARVPSVLVAAAQLVLLLLWFTHRWASDVAFGGWLPNGSSIRAVIEALLDSVAVAQSYAAPVSDAAPEMFPLLIVTGSLVAVLVDFLACGLSRVPVAGLPLLALYTAPVSILDNGVPWWVFATGAISFLTLLAAEEGRRLMSWGRRVPHSETLFDTGGGASVSTASLRTSARKIGLTATGLAVVTPVLVPTLSLSLFAGGQGGNGSGDSVAISNPMVNLKRDLVRDRDVDLLRVTTDDANPTYLRISVLDAFDGAAWRPSERDIPLEQRARGPLPPPPGLDSSVRRQEVGYEIDIFDTFDSNWLPAPYPVTTIETPGDWRYDVDTFDFVSAARNQSTTGLSYSLSALEISPRAEELIDAAPAPESIFTPYTELPEDLPDSVTELAREVTQGLSSRFEKAVRLQRWFREDGGFEYSLEREPGTGTDDLVSFLSAGPDGRIGYCEQFAASMAVMGRTLGIPSRVAVGFLRPDRVGENEYLYSSWDLHAWPEMYFDDVGWVRFEPTPGDRASGVPGYTTGEFTTPQPTEAPTASTDPRTADDLDRRRLDEGQGAATSSGGDGGGSGTVTGLLIGLALAGLLVSPRLLRAAVRRRRWSSARTPAAIAEAAWSELRDVALDLRLGWNETLTLRTQARRLTTEFGRPTGPQTDGAVRGATRGPAADPEAVAALERLVRGVELARYARRSPDQPGRPTGEVLADVSTVERALRQGTVKRTRRAATWLPASLVSHGFGRPARRGRTTGRAPLAEAGIDRAT